MSVPGAPARPAGKTDFFALRGAIVARPQRRRPAAGCAGKKTGRWKTTGRPVQQEDAQAQAKPA
ncbi:hypothetical protein ACKI2N_000945 [Cupriavidus sp. 30B13]|uniref:hypothetical protein n=1 Tax=Cupriavidus sp. 30B13 TaxID=3384241 RepID=UPI003B8F8230